MEVLFLFMVSKELEDAIQSYEDYINANGIDENVINAYVMACGTAYKEDIEYGKQVSARAKGIIEQFVLDKTGGTIWDLDSSVFPGTAADHTGYSVFRKDHSVSPTDLCIAGMRYFCGDVVYHSRILHGIRNNGKKL